MTCISLNLRHVYDVVLLSIKVEVIRFIHFLVYQELVVGYQELNIQLNVFHSIHICIGHTRSTKRLTLYCSNTRSKRRSEYY